MNSLLRWFDPLCIVLVLMLVNVVYCMDDSFNQFAMDTVDEEEEPYEKRAEIETGWSAWSEWTTCSRTCDGGAAHQLRRCNARQGCRGEGIRYMICNMQSCPEPTDFRVQQCSSYNDIPYQGKLYEWEPHYDSQDPCSLTCRVVGQNIVTQLAPKVLDGTRCRDGSLDMCINGKCQPVGCDLQLGSTKKVDACGICGGDDSSCVKPNFFWEEMPTSSCSATCGGGAQRVKAVCKNKRTGEEVDERLCDLSKKPPTRTRSCNADKCPASWTIEDWGPCSASCDGGWQERKVYCAETSSDGTSTRVEETRCSKRKPKSKQHCNTEDCPKWHEGPWSGCSVSCGQGYQTRNVYCRDVRGHVSNICDQRTKPQSTRSCTSGVACHKPKPDMREQAAPIVQPYPPPQAQRYTGTHIVSSEPSFVPEAWGSCNVSCGEGYRRRKVDCKIFLEFSRTVAKLPDKECPGNKPSEIEHCTMKPCAMSQMDSSANYVEDHKNKISYSWRQTGFTPCSASCLGGVRESIIQCIRDNDQVLVSPYLCDISKKPDVLTQTCNDQPCPPRWNVSDFSPCSKPCGSGLQTRHVQCVHEVTRGGNTLVVPNGVCTQPPPRAQQFCNVFDCPPKWVPSPWTKCSKSCGGGMKTRKLQCQQVQALGQAVERNPSQCSGARMATTKACNVKQCVPGRHNPSAATPHIYFTKQAYVQSGPRRRVSLKIGGRAILYRGTHLTVKCPVGKFNRSRIRWTKNQGPLTYSGRLKISKNGALRIRSVQAIDSGIYTCIAGRSRANITVIVKGPTAPKWTPPEPGMSIDRPPNVVDSRRPFSPKDKQFNKKPPPKTPEQDNKPSFTWLNKDKENHLPPEDKNSIETPIWDAVADQSAEKPVTERTLDSSVSISKADLDKVTDMRVMPHIQQLLTNIKHTFSSKNGPRTLAVGSDDLDSEGLGDHAVASSFVLGKGKAENLEFDWMVTDWSACSQSCGSGAYQVRASQCVVRLHNVSKTVDHSLCIDAGMQPPLTKQKCGMEECPHWEATEWSPCEVSRCAAVNMATQRRTVRCKLKNGTTITDKTCNMKTKPRQSRQCYSDQCKGTWRTGEWSQCTVSCGELAFRSRIVQCVWVGTKKAAGNACRDTPRPSVVRPCRGPVCPKNK